MYAHILVPLDHGALSQRGLTEAISLARALGSKLHVLHAVDLRSFIQGAAEYSPPAGVIDEWKAMGEALVAKALEQARAVGVQAEGAVICDAALRVCDMVLHEARRRQVQLIVMGTHGRRGFTRLVLGSDAEMVLRESKVPVMLVRGEDDNAG